MVWLAVYVVVPLALAVLLARHRPGPAAAAQHADEAAPLPTWLSVALAAQGVVFAGVGLALYLVPASEAVLWAWTLTPLAGGGGVLAAGLRPSPRCWRSGSATCLPCG